MFMEGKFNQEKGNKSLKIGNTLALSAVVRLHEHLYSALQVSWPEGSLPATVGAGATMW